MGDIRKEESARHWKERVGIKEDIEERKVHSNSLKEIKRKNKSNEIIKKMGIPVCHGLPILEDDMVKDFKSLDQICKRAIASLITIHLACDIKDGYDFNKSKDIFYNLLKEYGVQDCLNYTEKKIFDGNYSHQEVLNITWTYESYWVLVWALGLVDDISIPNSICDCEKAVKLVSNTKSFDEFKSQCKLRDAYEVLDMLDLYYRYHWACVEKRINPNTNIADLNPEVVYERRRGLEWLFSEEEDWFEVFLDT